MRTTALILLLAGGALVGNLDAQQHQHGQVRGDTSGMAAQPGGQMRMMQGGMMQEGMAMEGMMEMMRTMPAPMIMMRAMRFAPNRIKKSAEMLGLTPEQEGAVDELIERSASARHEMMQAGMAGGEALSDLFDAEPLDTAEIRSAALDAYQMHAAMHAQMLVDAAAVRSILTPAQREKAMMSTMSMPMRSGMSDPTMPRDSGHGHNRR